MLRFLDTKSSKLAFCEGRLRKFQRKHNYKVSTLEIDTCKWALHILYPSNRNRWWAHLFVNPASKTRLCHDAQFGCSLAWDAWANQNANWGELGCLLWLMHLQPSGQSRKAVQSQQSGKHACASKLSAVEFGCTVPAVATFDIGSFYTTACWLTCPTYQTAAERMWHLLAY